MAEYPLLQRIKVTVGEWIDAIQGKPKPEHPLIRYGTPLLFTLLGLVGLSAIYVGYRWYATNKEQHAQYACSMLIDEYMELQKQENPDYTAFMRKATTSYTQYKKTTVAPYMGLLMVDAHLKLGDHAHAVDVMQELADTTVHNAVIGDLFKIKHALLMIDADDATQQEEGFKQLMLLAESSTNPHRDYALYHLGLYHWNKNNLPDARVAWQELVDTQEVELRAPSPWAGVIAERLSTIPA